jgi:hypothetical protein
MPAYYAGLDLGQVSDFSALVVNEYQPGEAGKKGTHSVRYLKRWTLKTPYPEIVSDTRTILTAPALKGARLIVDGTGVGVAVVDLFKQAKLTNRLAPVTITGGSAASAKNGWWTVPKRDLAGVLQVLLGESRLQVAPALDLASTLQKEMMTFKVKVNIATGNESFEAWRERDHDDLVLATALACWWPEKGLRRLNIFA